MKQIGALWKPKNDSKAHLTGELDLGLFGKVKIGIFPNDKKEGKQPHFRIVLFENKE